MSRFVFVPPTSVGTISDTSMFFIVGCSPAHARCQYPAWVFRDPVCTQGVYNSCRRKPGMRASRETTPHLKWNNCARCGSGCRRALTRNQSRGKQKAANLAMRKHVCRRVPGKRGARTAGVRRNSWAGALTMCRASAGRGIPR